MSLYKIIWRLIIIQAREQSNKTTIQATQSHFIELRFVRRGDKLRQMPQSYNSKRQRSIQIYKRARRRVSFIISEIFVFYQTLCNSSRFIRNFVSFHLCDKSMTKIPNKRKSFVKYCLNINLSRRLELYMQNQTFFKALANRL